MNVKDKPKDKDDARDKLLARMTAHATYTSSRAGISNMIALARTELAIGPDVLDTNPWVLNVENGTLDLRTGSLRPHRREDFITKLAPVAYDPAAACPVWDAFLARIFKPHPELVGYLQRLIGYALTGDTSEHVLPFLYGTGANGKSTLCKAVLDLLGADYAMKAAPDLLMAKNHDSHPTDRADLFGKRLVACVETEMGRRMAEALVKELTGGDSIRARRMREDFWQFKPSHKIWLAGNHKPVVLGTDHGIWRRLKLIPFDVVIPNAEQDKHLDDKLVGERPGILNWALAGCLAWQADGMNEPAIVRTATGDYATEQDDVGGWLADSCDIATDPAIVDYRAGAGDLYKAFLADNPGVKITQIAFGKEMARRGFIPGNTKSGSRAWLGLRLKSTAQAQKGIDAIKDKKGGAK